MDIKKGQFSFLQLPLLWISLAFLVGIAVGELLELSAWLLLAFTCVVIFASVRKMASSAQLLGLLCCAALILGGARLQLAQPTFDPGDLAFYNDEPAPVSIFGWLAKPPVYRETYVELLLRSEAIHIQERSSLSVGGLVLVRVGLGADWRYGDQVRVTGYLEAPQNDEEFAYRDFLANQGVYSIVAFPQIERLSSGNGEPFWDAVYALRQRASDLIYRLYPDPEAGLLAGVLLGDESGLSDSLKSAFNVTGTRHIIAISGFNISIIAGVVLGLFTRCLGIRRGLLLAAVAILGYTVLVGAGPSVVRAAVMALLALLARKVGRDQFGLNTLAIVAAGMTVLDPLILFDVGFQLSFAATAGIMLYTEPLRVRASEWMDKKLPAPWASRLKAPANELIFMTLAAQLTTLPLLLIYFGRISLISLPANLLVLPLQPALMIFGGLSVGLGLLIFPIGRLLSLSAWSFAGLTIRLAELLASVPFASREIGYFTWWHALFYYAVLVVLSIPSLRRQLSLIRLRPAVPAAALGILAFSIWVRAAAVPNGMLEITLLDLEGEAILIRTPSGRNLLINGGPSSVALSQELGRLLPFGARQLDWIVVAGERPEQINGLLANTDRLSYEQFAWASAQPPQELLSLFQAVANTGREVHALHSGQRIDLHDGVALDVLYVGQRGAMLTLTWNEFAVLLPLGLDFNQMDDYAQDHAADDVDLLLLADAGYPPLNTAAWLNEVGAKALWLSADGLLTADLIAAADSRPMLHAAELGWLRATTDGVEMWLSSEHK